MKKTNSEVAVIDVPVNDIVQVEVINPYDKMIEMAITSDASMEKLEKFLELKERHEANEARKAYFDAFAEFSKNPPVIKKSSKVRYKNSDGSWTNYSHADCGEALNLISKHLAPHGLSISFKQKQENGSLTITCFLTHRLGYQESTFLAAAPDKSGGKNGIQGIGSSDSYLKRYTALSITGLHAIGEDDDGKTAESVENELITESQEADLLSMIEEKKVDLPKFLQHFKIAKLSELWATTYPSAVSMVEAKK